MNCDCFATSFRGRLRLDGNSFTPGGGATETALIFAACCGCKDIDLYGFDGNNVILGLSGQSSHFYGIDPLKNWEDLKFVSSELRFLSVFILANVHLARLLKSSGINIRNLSQTSLMRMYDVE